MEPSRKAFIVHWVGHLRHDCEYPGLADDILFDDGVAITESVGEWTALVIAGLVMFAALALSIWDARDLSEYESADDSSTGGE